MQRAEVTSFEDCNLVFRQEMTSRMPVEQVFEPASPLIQAIEEIGCMPLHATDDGGAGLRNR